MVDDKFAKEFVAKLDGKISPEILKIVYDELEVYAGDYDISQKITDIVPYVSYLPEWYKVYFVAKKIEGCSMGTIDNYNLILTRFFEETNKNTSDITTNDIRVYLYEFQQRSKCKDIYLDNIRLVINSFMEWSVTEGYLVKNPCKGINKIKFEQAPREPLSALEMEKLRYGCDCIRDRAILEVLYSTGCRVSELVRLNRVGSIDFLTKEVFLFGKGKKHRVSYLNARAEVALKMYLDARTDDNPALFVGLRAPHKRLAIEAVQDRLRRLGEKCNIGRPVFPHLIRHTTATDALNHGMNIVELKDMFGHAKMSTTLIYAKVAQQDVKRSHEKYIV